MKKLYFAAIAALLALAIVSCDNFAAAPKTEKGGNEDGLVFLTLGTGGTSRALNATLGRAGTTYYEASFRQGANIVRATWSWATVGRITLAPGTYEVILLAGRNSDKTLLGVGRVTNVDGAGTVGNPGVPAGTAGDMVTIVADSTTLTFTVAALTNDLSVSEIGGDITFEVTGAGALNPAPMLDEFGNSVPVFMLEKGGVGIGTWTFDIPGAAGDAGDLGGVALDIFVAAPGGKVQSTGYSSKDANSVPYRLVPTWTGPGVNASIGTIGFTFTMTAPNEDGAAYIAIEVPVYAFAVSSATVAAPITWYIRGGLNNGMVDAGHTPTNATQKQGQLGGAIIIGFGNIDALPTLILNPLDTWL